MTVLLLLHAMLSRLAAYVPAVSRLVEGVAVDLTVGGKLTEGIRRRFGLSPLVIREALPHAGIDEVEKARRLVLKRSGKVSTVRDSILPEQFQALVGKTPPVWIIGMRTPHCNIFGRLSHNRRISTLFMLKSLI